MRALLIEWNPESGHRAGGINPRDPKLQCHGWQNMDVSPALEIRIVEDNRDLSMYKNSLGITILDGKEVINQAIQDNFPPKYQITDMFLLREHLKEKSIPLDAFVGESQSEMAKECYDKGLIGVVEIKAKLVE